MRVSKRTGHTMLPLLLAFSLLFIQSQSSTPLADARIEKSVIKNDDRSLVPVTAGFGFQENGVIQLTLSEMSILVHEGMKVTDIDKSKIGFVMTKISLQLEDTDDTTERNYRSSNTPGGPLQLACLFNESSYADSQVLFTWEDVQKKKENGVYVYEIEMGKLHAGRVGQYIIYYNNCNPGSALSFKLKASLYNLSANGLVKNYLSTGEIPLPYMYLTFFFVYLAMMALWGYEIFVKEKLTAKRIHSFMFLLLVFKSLTLLSQTGMYFLIMQHGEPEGWRYVYYLFSFARGLMLFTVIILVGTGYTFIKPFLSEREKKIIMIVLPLQVTSDIAQVILNEETPITRGYFVWNDLFHLVDIICCCAVLFPIVWSIKHHREAAAIDGKAARNVMKLVLFRQFYIMVVAYVYFTRIIVELLKSSLTFEHIWFSDFMNEAATVLFYVVTAWKFRPMGDNPYFQLQDGDLSEEEMSHLIGTL